MTRYLRLDPMVELRLALTALLLLLVGLKLGTDGPVASWPWWAVLLPIEAPAAVFVLACAWAVILGIREGIDEVRQAKARAVAKAAAPTRIPPNVFAGPRILDQRAALRAQFTAALAAREAEAIWQPDYDRITIRSHRLAEPLVLNAESLRDDGRPVELVVIDRLDNALARGAIKHDGPLTINHRWEA